LLLFDQANTVVTEARFEKHLSERKVGDVDRVLGSAVQLMQVQMQSMWADKNPLQSSLDFAIDGVHPLRNQEEDSISFENSDIADYKVFSDGSGQDDGIGASAIP
jgi:hypothetical protein